jgi:tagatose 1,6-diphosphate aldolase
MTEGMLGICTEALDPGVLEDGELVLVLESFGEHAIHHVPAYHFGMRHAVTGEAMGGINLRLRLDADLTRYAGQVGYRVAEPFRGHGYAARALRLLMPLVSRVGYGELWITCDPANAASRRSCERAGAELVEIVGVPQDSEMYRLGIREKCRYRLLL